MVHESCGVFIRRHDGKILLFKRKFFPFLLTIPAGHLEKGEDPTDCAKRELWEETGLRNTKIKLVFEGLIDGDSCLGGADIHKWHAYVAEINQDDTFIHLNEEGLNWDWYDLTEISYDNTVQPVVYLIQNTGVLLTKLK